MSQRKINDISEIVNLSFNEVVLKTYEAFELIDPSGNGVFSVTNKRLIFVATGSSALTSSTSITEWMLDDIKGIQSEHGKRRHRGQTTIANIIGIIAVLLGLLVAMMFFSGREVNNFHFIGYMVFLIFLILKLTAKRKMFALSIYGGTTTPIVKFSSSFYKSAILGQIQIKPSKFTNTMIKDLGSTILNAKGK